MLFYLVSYQGSTHRLSLPDTVHNAKQQLEEFVYNVTDGAGYNHVKNCFVSCLFTDILSGGEKGLHAIVGNPDNIIVH